jgi:hypothetical protein
MRRILLALLGAALLQNTLVVAQSTQTGVLTGTVRNGAGAALAGATVSAASESVAGGPRTTTSDSAGRYRFPALPPGIYHITVTLADFRALDAIAQLHLGQRATLDVALQPGSASDRITASAVVSETSSVASTHITADFLSSTPIAERFGQGAIRLAPGVNPQNESAYGGVGPWSNAYRLDDLDSADPENGRAWVFPALNWIDEVRVVRLGAGAEHGGFTGAASDTLLRSGTNAFHGLAEALYRNGSLTTTNVPADVIAANPDLAPAQTDLVSDSSVQVGGPMVRDALWFFAGAQFYYARQTPGGYPAAVPAGVPSAEAGTPSPSESSPRVLFRPTWKRSDRTTVSGFVHSERTAVQARGAAPRVAPEATLEEHSGTTAWSGHFTRVLSSSTVVDAGYSGFHGTQNLEPYNGATPGWYDVAADYYSANSYYSYDAGRERQQAEAVITRFFGAHDLAVGGLFDAGSATTTYAYPGGRSIDAASGVPLFVYLWDGSNKASVTRDYAAYGQDSWRLQSGLSLNAGARFERTTGRNTHANGTVYSTNSLAPRIGLAWDPGGNGSTVLRGHYGWYYDAAYSAAYDSVDPNIAPLYGVQVDRRLNLNGPLSLLQPGTNHTVAAGLQAPRSREAVAGVEHAFFKRIDVTVYAIERRGDRYIDDVLQAGPGSFARTTVKDVGPDGFAASGDETTNTADLYSQGTNALQNQFLITNLPGAFRTYRGLEVTARRRVTGRWGVEGSWVLARLTGNYDASGPGLSADFETPNTDPALQPLRTGRLANDTTHIAKVFGTYRLPLRVSLSGAFYYTSGGTFTRTQDARLNQGRVEVFIEPRGSQRYDAVMRLDGRAQRQFSIAGRRIALEVDGFNLLNDAAVTSRIVQSGFRYFRPVSLVEPRRFRLGIAYRF